MARSRSASPKSSTAAPPVARSRAQVVARKAPVKVRLSPAEREKQIIDGAIAYFSEVGFSGQTRELSKRLGITQPLLYRYFSSKQALVERVYKTVFEGRWNPAWVSLIRDRSIPLRARLIEFYRQYSEATYRPDWMRIYLYAGLSDPLLNQRYIGLLQRELLPVYCREVRHYCGIESPDLPVSSEEIEFIWSLHGGMFYYAVRQHVYLLRMDVDFMFKVEYAVDNFLAGAKTTYPRLLAALPGSANSPARKTRGARAR